jgi:hypothetical protein
LAVSRETPSAPEKRVEMNPMRLETVIFYLLMSAITPVWVC